MTFQEQLIVTVVDKLLIAALILILGYGLNKLLEEFRRRQAELLQEFKSQRDLSLETFKRQQSELLEEFKSQRALSLETYKSQQSFKNELAKLRDAKHIDYLDKQLSQFYWPMYMRLHTHNAIWAKFLHKQKGDNSLREKFGKEIENNFILPNHEEIVQIIQSNIHLAESDSNSFNAMLQYIRYVAVLKAMRAVGDYNQDPSDFGVEWPDKLTQLIQHMAFKLQTQYDRLTIRQDEPNNSFNPSPR